MHNTLYSSVFSKQIGDKMTLYIDESNHISYPNRKYNIIYSDLILTEIRSGSYASGAAGIIKYKIAIFKNDTYCNRTVEFIQFEDGIGSIVEIYKDNYIFNDCIYNISPLNHTIFEKCDNDNYYYEKIIRNVIVNCRNLDCVITLYSNLYNIDCKIIETQKSKSNNYIDETDTILDNILLQIKQKKETEWTTI